MKIKNNNILATGPEGFIGTQLCEKLVGINTNVMTLGQYKKILLTYEG